MHHVLLSSDHLSSSSLSSLHYINVFSCHGVLRLDTILHMQSHKCLIKGKNYSLQLAANFLPIHCRTQLAFFAWLSLPGLAHCLFCKDAFCPAGTKPVLLHGKLFPPRWKAWHLPLLNFMKFLSAHLSCLSRSLCNHPESVVRPIFQVINTDMKTVLLLSAILEGYHYSLSPNCILHHWSQPSDLGGTDNFHLTAYICSQ